MCESEYKCLHSLPLIMRLSESKNNLRLSLRLCMQEKNYSPILRCDSWAMNYSHSYPVQMSLIRFLFGCTHNSKSAKNCTYNGCTTTHSFYCKLLGFFVSFGSPVKNESKKMVSLVFYLRFVSYMNEQEKTNEDYPHTCKQKSR